MDEELAHGRYLYLHNKRHSQKTDIHDLYGIRIRNPSKRVAADPRLKPRRHSDQLELT
jgi:hypothetical protein